MAYCLAGEEIPGFLRHGTTTEQYQAACNAKKMAKVVDLFGGRLKLKLQAQAVMQGIKVG